MLDGLYIEQVDRGVYRIASADGAYQTAALGEPGFQYLRDDTITSGGVAPTRSTELIRDGSGIGAVTAVGTMIDEGSIITGGAVPVSPIPGPTPAPSERKQIPWLLIIGGALLAFALFSEGK